MMFSSGEFLLGGERSKAEKMAHSELGGSFGNFRICVGELQEVKVEVGSASSEAVVDTCVLGRLVASLDAVQSHS